MALHTQNLIEYSKIQQSKRVQELLMAKLKLDVKSTAKVVVSKSVSSAKPSYFKPAVIKMIPKVSNISLKKKKESATHLSPSKAPSTSTSLVSNKRKSKIDDFDSQNIENDYDPLEKSDSDETNSLEIMRHVELKSVQNMKRLSSNNSEATPAKMNKNHSQECCSCCRETLEIILHQQNEMLNLLKTSLSKPTTFSTEKLDLLPPMPFDDINDFLDFDESLNNENVQYQFIVKLNKLLVLTEQKSVSNIMSSILSNGLCKNISWVGVKDTIPFSTSNMVGLIVDLLQEHHQISMDIIKNRIAEWLRRCGDRINNELKRRQKKIEQGFAI